MLKHFFKRLWFVGLMVFAMGWSSVVLASGQLMHQQMNIPTHQQNKTHSLEITSAAHCHQLQHDTQSHHVAQKQHEQPQHTKGFDAKNHDADKQQHDLFCLNMDDQTADHVQCHDCAQVHCQTSNSIYAQDHQFEVVVMQSQEYVSQDYDTDQAQHLTGYWQQILRPPKA